MTEAQIIAEIEQRYSLPVMKGAYQVCPPGRYSWQDTGETGPITPRQATENNFKRVARVRRLAKADGPRPIKELDEIGKTIVEMAKIARGEM